MDALVAAIAIEAGAAIAIEAGATVATRGSDDFADLALDIVDPWAT